MTDLKKKRSYEKKHQYMKTNFEPVMFRVKKGERQRIKYYADLLHLSVNEFVGRAVAEKIKSIVDSQNDNGAVRYDEKKAFSKSK